MQFYENYVRLCNAEGKKPTAVADEIGITRATASRWSRGMVPSYPNLLKIAEHFGISVGELVGATPENVKELAKYFSVSESLLFIADAAKKGNVQSLGGAEEEILETLRTSPGRRMLFAATKHMTEEQIEAMANFANSLRSDKD